MGIFFLPSVAQASLTLANAESIALETDSSHQVSTQKALALEQRAIADAQLPDPRLKIGMMNLPTNSFNRSQEAMTQLQLGVQQAFPAGDSLKYKASRTASLANVEHFKADKQKQDVLRSVRMSWLENVYWTHAEQVIKNSRRLFKQLLSITRSRYASGGKNQQDVIQAELELEKLTDREIRIASKKEQNKADLARWIGHQNVLQAGFNGFPEISTPVPYDILENNLKNHPSIKIEAGKVNAGKKAVQLAKEAYKPKWMLDVTYGDRIGNNPDGSERDDFLSAMVLLDIPLFTENRQDRNSSASQLQVNAAQKAMDSVYLELQSRLQRDYSNWQHLQERVSLYEDRILPQSKESVRSALKAYQSRRGDFTSTVKARLAVLNTELDLIRLKVDLKKEQVNLLFLQGEK
jgi:outer membrane protein TolC